jgi:hypothetical protein
LSAFPPVHGSPGRIGEPHHGKAQQKTHFEPTFVQTGSISACFIHQKAQPFTLRWQGCQQKTPEAH